MCWNEKKSGFILFEFKYMRCSYMYMLLLINIVKIWMDFGIILLCL